MAAIDIAIVTKGTNQTYSAGGSTIGGAGSVNRLLSVSEVDANFINLKQGVVDLEYTASTTYAPLSSPALTGTGGNPATYSRTIPTGTSSFEIATTSFVQQELGPTANIVSDVNVGNQALNTKISLKANLNGPTTFTGALRLSGANNATLAGDAQRIVNTGYVDYKLQNIDVNLLPTTGGQVNIGTSANYINQIHVKEILPAGTNTSIGTASNPFDEGYFANNTIFIGSAGLSQGAAGGIVLPEGSAFGDEDSTIPRNLISTELDKAFGDLTSGPKKAIKLTLVASGSISSGDAIILNSNGTVSAISSTNTSFIGFAATSATNGNNVDIIVAGPVTGLSGLLTNSEVLVSSTGALKFSRTLPSDIKVGTATSTTELFLYSTSTMDIYALAKAKAELADFSVNTSSAGSNGLTYNSSTGVFDFTPVDLSTFATQSYVDTEIANLVNSAPTSLDTLDELAAALNDDANFASTVTNSIATKAPLASPALTGTPTAPTASSSTNTTQIATTAFVQTEIADKIEFTNLSVTTAAASSGGALSYNNSTGAFTFTPADTTSFGNASLNSFSVTTNSPSGSGALSYNNSTGVFSFTPAATFDGAFSSLSGTPTTISGYGITDAVPFASPTFTGIPAAPTAASGTNTTQLATTAFVQGEISGFSSTGGDSQRDYTASGAITDKNAVVLNTNGTVSNVSVVAAGINTSTRPLHNATNYAHNHSGVDWNSTDSVYHHAWRDNATLYIKAESPNFSALTLSQSVITTTSLGGTANSKLIYKHIDGTSTGILVYNVSATYYAKYITYDATTPAHNIGTNTYTLPAEPFDVVIKDSGRMFILYGDRVDSIAIDATAKTFSLTDNTTVGMSSTSAHVFRLFWDSAQSKLITFRLSGTTNQYQYISESSGSLTASSVVTASSTIAFHQIEYHPGLSTYFGFRWQFVRTGNEDRYYPYFTPLTVGASAVTYGTEVQAPIYLSQYDAYNQHSGSGAMRFVPSKTGNSVSIYHLMRIASSGAESQGREHFAFGTLNSSGTYTSSSGFASMIGVNSGDQAGTSAHDFGTSIDRDGYAYVSYPISYGSGGSTTKVASTLIRTASVSTASDYLGIAQNAASDGGTVTVMLAGGISTGHSSLTQGVKYYVQNNGTLATTSTSTVAGQAVATDSIQVADSQGTFSTSTAFVDLTSTPTTLSGYGITDALSSTGDIDIGSSDFITTGKSYFANMFATTGDLPSATTYHGMFAHVHGTGKGYFAHGGNWIELANASTTLAGYGITDAATTTYVDTEIANLVDSAPGTLDTLNELAAALGDDANFSTTITTQIGLKAPLASPALTGTPTAPTAASGTNTTQVATTAFVTAAVGSGGGGGASVTTSDAAPSSPSAGDLWYNTSAGGLFVYYQDVDSSQWVEVIGKTGATGPTNVSIGDIAPTSPSTGQFWWNSSTNKLYIYYTDANSSQWVQATTPGAASTVAGPQGPTGPTGPAGTAAITRYANVAAFPASPTAADLAYANDTNTVYVYNGTAWEVVASGNNETPVITTEPPTATQSLNSDGTTSTVTMVAQDPEGFDITYGIAYKTANNARPAQLSADTTINQSTGVFTFTPSTTQSDAGSFRARLSASDGARITTRFVDFDLGFYPAASGLLARYEFYDTNCYNPSTSTTALNDNSGNGNNQTINNPGTHTGSGNMTFNSNTTITFTGLNATKAWFVLYYPPSGWNQGILFGSGGSTYYSTFKNGDGNNYYGSAYSAHSGATIVDRVNGTNPTSRGVAYSAMDISAMNSIINSGTNMSTSLTYQQYSGWTPTHYVRAMVFFDREITLTEMEALHNHYRTNWLAAGGTMPTWGN